MTSLMRKRVGIGLLLAVAASGLVWWNLSDGLTAGGSCLIALPRADDPTRVAAADEPAGPAMPDISITTLTGDTVTPKSLEGEIVVVNFWATWCPPCVAEIPDLVAVSQAFDDRGVTFLGLSVDNPKMEERVRQFLDQREVPYANAIVDMGVYEAFGGRGAIPTTFIFDASGRQVAAHVGLITREKLESLLEPLVADRA
ncbi:MAG: TlpA family protein disulfide reductase [Opitutales bacterium]